MSLEKNIAARVRRRSFRVRNKFASKGIKPRVTVSRSLQNIFVQLIDDASGTTLASFSSLHLKDKHGDKKAVAKQVGLELGKLATEKDINEVFFDRGCYLYHGRVKALADGLREGGLSF